MGGPGRTQRAVFSPRTPSRSRWRQNTGAAGGERSICCRRCAGKSCCRRHTAARPGNARASASTAGELAGSQGPPGASTAARSIAHKRGHNTERSLCLHAPQIFQISKPYTQYTQTTQKPVNSWMRAAPKHNDSHMSASPPPKMRHRRPPPPYLWPQTAVRSATSRTVSVDAASRTASGRPRPPSSYGLGKLRDVALSNALDA